MKPDLRAPFRLAMRARPLRDWGQVWGQVWWPGNLVVLWLGVLLALVVFADAPMRQLARGLDPSVRALLQEVTALGNAGWSLIGSMLLWLGFGLLARRRAGVLQGAYQFAQVRAGFVFACLAGSGLAVQVLKSLIGRGRPNLGDPMLVLSFHPFAFQAGWQSFPSGHSTSCFALALALSRLWPRLGPALVVLASWGALSRALLGVHWASDVLAGATLGGLSVWLVQRQFRDRQWPLEPCALPAGRLILRDLRGLVWRLLAQALSRPR